MSKKLFVMAKYGSLVFSEIASPYNEKAHKEQLETCAKSILRQIKNSGKAEMLDAFVFKDEIID